MGILSRLLRRRSWVVTIQTDEGPIHVMLESKDSAASFISGIRDEFGPVDITCREVPSNWECSGEDECDQ